MSSGPQQPRLDWPEARRLAELYRQAYGVVPADLAGYVETGDEAWLEAASRRRPGVRRG